MDFGKKYNQYKDIFTQQLDAFVKRLESADMPQKLRDSVVYSLMAGGKRIRPVLCLACADVSGGELLHAAPFALALELIHTYSLIHDDLPCMDNDSMRRGKPTNHMVYGEATALLAGDALLTFAHEIMLEHIYGARTKYNILAASVISRCAGATGMIGGQALDISCQAGECAADLKNLEYIHLNKTGALLRACAAAGAHSAGAGTRTVTALSRYGAALGLLFQITDDILDETATAQTLGKSVGKDKASGKLTYVTLLGLQKSRRIAQKYLKIAKDNLKTTKGDTQFLYELADFVSTRGF